MIDKLDEKMIRRYFWTSDRISKLNFRKKELREIFYSQSFYTHTEYYDDSMKTRCFRIEDEVGDYLAEIESIERRIKREQFRLRKFNSFLESLSEYDQDDLQSKFSYNIGDVSPDVVERAIDEIYEIEAAVCLTENIDPGELERVELTEDQKENLKRMADFFEL